MQEWAKRSYINDGWLGTSSAGRTFVEYQQRQSIHSYKTMDEGIQEHLQCQHVELRISTEGFCYLMCGNNDVDAFENIIPYPLFSPELNIVGSRKHPCLKCG